MSGLVRLGGFHTETHHHTAPNIKGIIRLRESWWLREGQM